MLQDAKHKGESGWRSHDVAMGAKIPHHDGYARMITLLAQQSAATVKQRLTLPKLANVGRLKLLLIVGPSAEPQSELVPDDVARQAPSIRSLLNYFRRPIAPCAAL